MLLSAPRSSRPPMGLPPVAATLILATLAHAMLWSFRGEDIDIFLAPWFEHIRATGMIDAFSTPFSNYTPPYLYLLALTTPLAAILPVIDIIKLLSVLGTVALAGAVWRLLIATGASTPARGAALIFLLPSTLLNAPLLGQCDAMWAACCVMALAMATERRHAAMLAWLGLAVSLKLQAVFLGPFVVALLVNRHVPLRLWVIAPATAFATLMPAWAAGWPIGDLTTIYLRQAGQYNALSLNAPNLWVIVQDLPHAGIWPLEGLAFTLALGTGAAFIAWLIARGITTGSILPAALLGVLLVAGTLPHMHERYFFLCDILALAIALTRRTPADWAIAALIQAGSTLAILGYVLDAHALVMIGAVAMIVATYHAATMIGMSAAVAVDSVDAIAPTQAGTVTSWPEPGAGNAIYQTNA